METPTQQARYETIAGENMTAVVDNYQSWYFWEFQNQDIPHVMYGRIWQALQEDCGSDDKSCLIPVSTAEVRFPMIRDKLWPRSNTSTNNVGKVDVKNAEPAGSSEVYILQ